MNAHELRNLFDEWRQLTCEEREAIATQDWENVFRRQDRKRDLQTCLQLIIEKWKKSRTTAASGDREFEVRYLIAELISLEANNSALLAKHRAAAQQQLAELDKASRNLRGLNRAYSSTADAQWTSYS